MAHAVLLKLEYIKHRLSFYSWRAWARMIKMLSTENDKPLQFFYRANPSLGFSPRELNSLHINETKDKINIDVTVNFLGLQGASTPLPVHFSERIIQDDPDDSTLNEFYNFFNQQNYMMLLKIEQKYAYLPQVRTDATDALTIKLAAFAGLLDETEQQEPGLLAFLNGLVGTNLAKSAWCHMIGRLLGAERAWVGEYVPTRIAIPTEHCSILGSAQSILAETFSLGAYVSQAKNHVELHLAVQDLEDFLPNQANFHRLQILVRRTLRENLFVSVVLHPKQARVASLRRAHPVGLGWSTRLGSKALELNVVKLKLL